MSALVSLFLDVTVTLPAVAFSKVKRFAFTDALNSVPELVVEVFSSEPDLDMGEVVGQTATVEVREVALPQITGIVRRVTQLSHEGAGVSVFALTIVPQLWLLTQRRGHHIFQNKTALGIVEEVLGRFGPTMDKPEGMIFQRLLVPHEYRVQWGETDYDFLFRVLSEEGLVSFWAPDSSGKRSWFITDDTAAGNAELTVPYRPASGALREREPHVSSVGVNARLCPSEVKVRDYDPKKPAFLLERRLICGDASTIEEPLVQYSYGVGRFDEEAGGERLATLRLEEARAKSRAFRWEASFAMRAGMKIRLTDHPREDANGEFLVVSAWTEVDRSSKTYAAEVIPAGQPWRPEVRPKPCVAGTETAFVVGAPGKEIDVDKDGRVEVEFRWDTRDLHRAGASRRVRVAMPWAGRGRTFWTLPRVGDEVVVSYMHGDPDQPLIVGSVHNATAPVAVPLPESEAVSAWVSSSTPGGAGYNHIVMDDAAGKERLALRAERDYQCQVGRDSTTEIRGAQRVSVVTNHRTEVGGDSTIQADGDYTITGKKTISIGTLGALGMRGKTVLIAAEVGLVLAVGDDSSITIEKGKITLKSPLIELNP